MHACGVWGEIIHVNLLFGIRACQMNFKRLQCVALRINILAFEYHCFIFNMYSIATAQYSQVTYTFFHQ